MHRFQRWRQALQEAFTEEAVVGVMRDYVATIAPEVVSLLPQECREAVREPDLQSAAVTLIQCELAYQGSESIGVLLHEIAHTFAAASTRLTAIKKEVLPARE
jgi:predicted Zn-dependent protease with MMP-like domain